MAYSIQREVSDGTLQTLTLRITYFKKTHISVYVDDKLADGSAGRYSWVWDGERIRLNKVVPVGIEVMIRRKTPMDTPFHNFRQGAVFKDVTMDENFIQQLYINQENVEGLSATDFYSDLDLHNYRMKNVGTAINDTDAVSLGQYRADALGANQYRILAEASKVAAKVSETNTKASEIAARVSELEAKNSEVAAKGASIEATTAAHVATEAASNALVAEDAARVSELEAKKAAELASQYNGLFTQAGTGAVTRTAQDKMRESVSVKDFGAKGDGIADDTAAIQLCLSTHDYVIFPEGEYKVVGDLLFKSNQTMHITENAIIKMNGGRITPASIGVNNVVIRLDGKVVGISTTKGAVGEGGPPGKFDWTVISSNGKQYAERGLIEFGGSSVVPSSGFTVQGIGKVVGDWTGTPSMFDWAEMGRKGIASFRADNVLISSIDVSGFAAEAIYHEEQKRSARNIKFTNLYVHDTKFTALNFNVATPIVNGVISENVVNNAYQAIELSSGVAHNNLASNVVKGLVTGGAQVDTVGVSSNTFNVSLIGIEASASIAWENLLLGNVSIASNVIKGASQHGIYVVGLKNVNISNNVVQGACTDPSEFSYRAAISVAPFNSVQPVGAVVGNIVSGVGDRAEADILVESAGVRAKGNVVIGLDNTPYGCDVVQSPTLSSGKDYISVINPQASSAGYSTVFTTSRLVSHAPSVFASISARVTSLTGAGSKGYLMLSATKSSDASLLTDTLKISSSGSVNPATDNLQQLGLAISRWSVIYAGTGTINTSDGREKTAPLSITDAVLDAWGGVSFVAFKWLDAVRCKGEDSARWHFGVIAQQVRDAFAAHDIDGTRYGLLCYDEWEEEPDVFDEEGNVIQEAKPAGNRWGIRADQCLFLESAYQRRQMKRLEERLTMAGL